MIFFQGKDRLSFLSLLFALLFAVLFFISCDDEDESITYPMIFSFKAVDMKDSIKVYTKDGEISSDWKSIEEILYDEEDEVQATLEDYRFWDEIKLYSEDLAKLTYYGMQISIDSIPIVQHNDSIRLLTNFDYLGLSFNYYNVQYKTLESSQYLVYEESFGSTSFECWYGNIDVDELVNDLGIGDTLAVLLFSSVYERVD